MKHRSEWKAFLPAGRFTGKAHQEFFAALGKAFSESREFTVSETVVTQIQHSLDHDLRSESRPHTHGNDVRTIAENRKPTGGCALQYRCRSD